MNSHLIEIGLAAFLLWYDRYLFADIVAAVLGAVTALVMGILVFLCAVVGFVMIPVCSYGRVVLHQDTRAWTHTVVQKIMDVSHILYKKKGGSDV